MSIFFIPFFPIYSLVLFYVFSFLRVHFYSMFVLVFCAFGKLIHSNSFLFISVLYLYGFLEFICFSRAFVVVCLFCLIFLHERNALFVYVFVLCFSKITVFRLFLQIDLTNMTYT